MINQSILKEMEESSNEDENEGIFDSEYERLM